MKFGVCTGVDEAPRILAAGFDYVELGASGFGGLSETWEQAPYEGLPIGATNLFFDSRIKLFGPVRTPYREYAERTISRAASLGVPLMVIGSGASRATPDGTDGNPPFAEIVGEIADIGRSYKIEIAPESLNRTETNVGNDLRQLALSLKEKGAGYTADSYHILYEWNADGRKRGLDELFIEQIPFTPTHVHIADLPRHGVDSVDPMLQFFARRLLDLGYDGKVSLECSRDSDFDFAAALNCLQALFQA